MRPFPACLGLLAAAGPACFSSGNRGGIPGSGGGTQDTRVLKTDGGYVFDRPKWAPWEIPAL
jgi:hypothetical protein